MADDDKVNWNVDLEVGLFHAIYAHRPVGMLPLLLSNRIYRSLSDRQKQLIQLIRPVTLAQEYEKYM